MNLLIGQDRLSHARDFSGRAGDSPSTCRLIVKRQSNHFGREGISAQPNLAYKFKVEKKKNPWRTIT